MHEILLSTKPKIVSDPLISKVVVLSHFSTLSENNTFPDRKLHQITAYEGARLNQNDPPKFGVNSVEFNGGYLSIPGTDLDFPGDFTMEAWVYFRDFDPNTNTAIFGHSKYAVEGPGNFLLRTTYGASELHWAMYDGAYNSGSSNTAIMTGKVAGGMPAYTWFHVAVCRKDGVIRLFYNGKMISSINDARTLNVDSKYPLNIGGKLLFCRSIVGAMDELRITKAARYVEDFPVPKTSFSDS